MNKRKQLSKKIRFEIFKRDSFTCQYCGRKSPDVILEVDHICPVSKGGKNDMLNLITSCYECNRGKSDKKINDKSVVEKNRILLEELNEKREQIKMMIRWRDELKNIELLALNEATKEIERRFNGRTLTETGKNKIKKFINSYGLNEVLTSIDISFDTYEKDDSEETANLIFDKIGGILYLRSKTEIDRKISYIKGICRNRFNYFDKAIISIILNKYVESLRKAEWEDDSIIDDLDNEVIPFTKIAKNWYEWTNRINGWIDDINNWK